MEITDIWIKSMEEWLNIIQVSKSYTLQNYQSN